MKPDQIHTVQSSFDRIFPFKAELSESFYEKLFELAPQVRPMFPDDMTEQRQKLVDTLSYVVRNLHRPEIIEESIVGLARRHRKYGTQPSHFGPVGLALVHALKTHMPGNMAEEEGIAWIKAYTFIADMMIREIQQAA